jgi:ectoine hydroxylase-related dioxygenase (phytanoyl-CoA dioxygenase family)
MNANVHGAIVEQEIRQQGYTILRGLVSPADVTAALRLINGAFPRQGIRVEDRVRDHDLTYFPDLIVHGAVMSLYDSIAPYSKRLLTAPATPSVCQIALRFPAPVKELHPHIDGTINRTYEPHFSILAAVFLSAAQEIGDGSLCVWPGSHLKLVEQVRANGAAGLISTGRIPTPVGAPVGLQVSPGDVLLAHSLLVHSIGTNFGAHIRYAVFFRVRSKEQDEIGLKILEDPWLGWKSDA